MQNLTESQMEEVLQITAQALRQLNEFWGLKDQVVLRPPAAPQVLSDLAASVRFPLPPSYLRLMSLHDGIDNFYGIRGHLLHSRFRHIFPDFDKEWKRPQMWVFIADNDWNAVAFDTNTRNAEGEMEVLEIADNIDADRWLSLTDFLIAYRQRMETWVATEQADRTKGER